MTSTLLDDIKNNKIVELRLSSDPDDYFSDTKDFSNAMKENTSIQKVIFDQDFLACCCGADRKDIVQACGLLPNVETVILKDSALMIGVCITSLVNNSKKLKELSMEKCSLMGLAEDFQAFENALKQNSTLETLRVTDCTIANTKIKLNDVIESYKALSSSSSLVVVV